MKKLLIILSILLLSSCCDDNIETTKDSYTWIEDEFEFKGHHYLVFYYFDYHIVHDPDCPCHEYYKNSDINHIY